MSASRDVEGAGLLGQRLPLLYAQIMSRWDPKPTPYERWIVRHRKGLLVVLVVYMVLAIGSFVYCVVTSQLILSAALNAIVAIGLTINFVYQSRNGVRLIEKSDSTHDPVPDSGNHAPPHKSS